MVTRPHRPADLLRIGLAADGRAEPHLLTAVNDDVLPGLALAPVEERLWKSSDDLPIQGWLVTPADFAQRRAKGERFPLVQQIHGGPHSMYGVEWSFERQWLAAQGYCVLYGNPRGSTGYGGSGGSVLTAWIVGHTDRFAAAVSMFPVIDWISFVGTTDGPGWYWNFRKLPWEDITEHWNRSPLKYVGNVTTPTLLITGELDLRTPMAQTEEYYQALKYRKVETLMVRIPDEWHEAAGRRVSNLARRILYVDAWFKKHLPAGS